MNSTSICWAAGPLSPIVVRYSPALLTCLAHLPARIAPHRFAQAGFECVKCSEHSQCSSVQYNRWVVIADPSKQSHSSGAKSPACLFEDRTTGKSSNQWGSALGVLCCSQDGSAASWPGCATGKTLAQAKAICDGAILGGNPMRLCTEAEVRTGVGRSVANDGCGKDGLQVWTSSTCTASPAERYCDNSLVGGDFTCKLKKTIGADCGVAGDDEICVTSACSPSGMCQCVNDASCASISGRNICKTHTSKPNECVQCNANSHCAANQWCDNGAVAPNYNCHPKIVTGHSGCNLLDGRCVSGHCSATASHITGVCVACSEHSHCPADKYCDERRVGGSFTCKDPGGQHADCSGSLGVGREDRKCQSPLKCATGGGHCECKTRQDCITFTGSQNKKCSTGLKNSCDNCNGRNAWRNCVYSSIGEATRGNCCSGSVYQSSMCRSHWGPDEYWYYCS